MKINLEHWLHEQDIPPLAGQADPVGLQPPMTDPTPPAQATEPPPQQEPGAMPDITNQDITADPQAPEMPQEEPEDAGENFEVWKNNFFKVSISGDIVEMENLLKSVRNRDLEAHQDKFVEDNLQIIYLRKDANINKASKEIRKLIKTQLDKNNPSSSIVEHIVSVLETVPVLNNHYIKLSGMHGLKGDLHRKYISSLIGAVQVGSGSGKPQIIFEDKDYSIKMTTRCNSEFGDIDIGKWSLKEDDTQEGKFLTAPELKRLQEGSPEEKDVLKKRLVIESIAAQYDERAFIFNVIGEDGTVYHIGWDMSNSLRDGYQNGRLVVRTITSQNSEAMITDSGEIVPLVDIKIHYTRETGEMNDEGKPEVEELPFMERRDGELFLVANIDVLRESSSSLQALVLKEVPWRGNPSDIKVLQRAYPKADEMLLRNT